MSEQWNERCSQTDRAVNQVKITPLCVSSVWNIEGTLKETDIHLLRQIHSELYDITCLINNTYAIPILAATCWMLTGFLSSLYEILVNFKMWGIAHVLYTITYFVFFFKVTFFVTQLRTKQGLQSFWRRNCFYWETAETNV